MFKIVETFSNWCKQKVGLHVGDRSIKLFKQGEVWWCQIGMNIGDEVFGKGSAFSRPVLVYKKITKTTFLALPITTQKKVGSWYVNFMLHGVERQIMLNQARVLDSRRLQERVGELQIYDFKKIREQFIEFYNS